MTADFVLILNFAPPPLTNAWPPYVNCSGSRISIFASSYKYLFRLRMNMELIIYCRPRRAIL